MTESLTIYFVGGPCCISIIMDQGTDPANMFADVVRSYSEQELRDLESNIITVTEGMDLSGRPVGAVAMRLNVLAKIKHLRSDVLRSSLSYQSFGAGRANMLESHILSGEDIGSLDRRKQTAVHKAAEKGHAHVISLLSRAKADINTLDQNGKSPLDLVKDEKCRALLKTLGGNGWTPLMIAVEKGEDKVAQYIKCREVLLSIRDQIMFPSWFGDLVMFAEEERWTWDSIEESSMRLDIQKLKVRKTSNDPDYSSAVGEVLKENRVHVWSVRVQKVRSMWLGISRGIEENDLGEDPDCVGDSDSCELIIAFHSEADSYIVHAEPQPEFEFLNQKSEGKSQGTESESAEDSEANSSSTESNGSRSESQSEQQDSWLGFKSNQIIEFELDKIEHTLHVKVDGILKVVVRNVDDREVRPFVCMDYVGESATLLQRFSKTPQDALGLNKLITSQDKIEAFENRNWTKETDALLLRISSGVSFISVLQFHFLAFPCQYFWCMLVCCIPFPAVPFPTYPCKSKSK